MNHTAHIDHDAVLRARVALLGSGTLPVRRRVAAYRVLADVSPLAYLPLLAEALHAYAHQEFAHVPGISPALHTEAAAAARRMYELEPERAELLLLALARHREELGRRGYRERLGPVEQEIRRVAADRRR